MEIIPFDEIKKIGEVMALSGLFGAKTPEQAIALCLIAQAEGLHPAIAARDYHIIDGKPTLKSDAMLARFQKSGGRVKWDKYTDKIVEATFSHPTGGEITVSWDVARAMQAGLTGKQNWQKYPRQMLRSRVISEGIKLINPQCSEMLYTPEEVEFFTTTEVVPPEQIAPPLYSPSHKDIGELIKSTNEKLKIDFQKNIYNNRNIYQTIIKESFESESQLIERIEALLNASV